jgi:hypothetical protein
MNFGNGKAPSVDRRRALSCDERDGVRGATADSSGGPLLLNYRE